MARPIHHVRHKINLKAQLLGSFEMTFILTEKSCTKIMNFAVNDFTFNKSKLRNILLKVLKEVF